VFSVCSQKAHCRAGGQLPVKGRSGNRTRIPVKVLAAEVPDAPVVRV
jgi:hypothetical protein